MLKTKKCHRISVLIISLPFAFAEELSRTYDKNGNLVYDSQTDIFREYNELNQLIRIRQGNTSNGQILEEYTWHPVEERILIKDVYYNNTKNYTVYYISNEYIVIENSTGNYTEENIYQDNILVAQVDTNGNKIAVHPDHEGSSTTLTDAQGNIIETTFYSAYGEILSGGKTSRFDYEGKEYDSVVQDYDFGFRKYNPDVPPIFYQPDTLIPNVYDPQSLNRYAFERNNPYRYIDRYGHQQSQAEGHYVNGILEEIYEAKRIVQFIREEELSIRLNWEYNHKKNPSGQTMYGTNDQIPLFEELQKNDLRRNFFPDIDKNGNIIGYTYRDKYYHTISGLQGQGYYNKKLLQDESDYKYNLYLTQKKEEEKQKNRNRGSSSGGGGNIWDDLRKEAENAKKGETAKDIIDRWRKRSP